MSDKQIVEESSLLNYLLPGRLQYIICDRI